VSSPLVIVVRRGPPALPPLLIITVDVGAIHLVKIRDSNGPRSQYVAGGSSKNEERNVELLSALNAVELVTVNMSEIEKEINCVTTTCKN